MEEDPENFLLSAPFFFLCTVYFSSTIQSYSVFILPPFILISDGHLLGEMLNIKLREVTVLLSNIVEKKKGIFTHLSSLQSILTFSVSLPSPSFHLYLMDCQGLPNGPECVIRGMIQDGGTV